MPGSSPLRIFVRVVDQQHWQKGYKNLHVVPTFLSFIIAGTPGILPSLFCPFFRSTIQAATDQPGHPVVDD